MRLLLKCSSCLWHPMVTLLWSMVLTAGMYPEHFPPSRIKLQEVSYVFTALLGFCHCQAVLHCHWRDTCSHRGMCPRHPAH